MIAVRAGLVIPIDKKRKVRNALFGAVLVATSSVVAFAAAEGLLRLIQFKYDYSLKIVNVGEEWRDVHMFEEDMFEPDPVLLWKPRSSTDGFVPFNSYGYRGREVASVKDGKGLRILAVGDSNTMGPAEYSWPDFLQARFDASCPDMAATVLNAGVYGYTSFQGVRRFQEGLKHSPDVVLIAFGWNDAVETTNAPDNTYGEQSLRFAAIKRYMTRNLRIYQLLRSTSDRFLRASAAESQAGDLIPRVSPADYRQNLTEIVSRATAEGILPVLMTRPNIVDTAVAYSKVLAWRRNLPKYNDIVRELTGRFDVPLVDAFRAFTGFDNYYFVDDNHLNESGAKRLAELVYSAITRNLDGCPEETLSEQYWRENADFRDSNTIAMKVAPQEVTAGRAYDLWLEGQPFANSTVAILYRLNNGEIQQFEAALNSSGRVNFNVSSATPKGTYQLIAFRPAGYKYYIRSDQSITVR